MTGYYELFLSRGSRSREMLDTLRHASTGAVGGYSRLASGATILTFNRKMDRDDCLVWCLRFAAERGLPLNGIL